MQIDPERWVDEHGDHLFRYAIVRLRDESLAEDAVQETLLSAIQSLGSYSGRSAERTWLIGILKHKIIDHFRKHSREVPLDPPTRTYRNSIRCSNVRMNFRITGTII